jgi:hypothetical protein
MAETHGNRTRLGGFSPPTSVLKTEPGTSLGSASSVRLEPSDAGHKRASKGAPRGSQVL